MLARTPRADVEKGLQAVIAAIESGRHAVKSKSQLAKHLGVTRQAISGWSVVPVEHVLEIEGLLKVPRHEIRSDVYPAPKAKKRSLKERRAARLRRLQES
jgi:DNA-binding transcriptional regulator YdaS (Cro superfamily)